MRRTLLPALCAVLALGFTIPSTATTLPTSEPAASQLQQVPGHAAETNPVGTLRWLPASANEEPPTGFGNERLVVTYDGSLSDDGEETELTAQGPFGMKIFTTAVVNGETLEEFPLRMIGHSPHVRSVDDLGGPEEVDEVFMGLSGDVRDADCALLHDEGPDAFSAAYTTTRVMPVDYEPADCELLGDEVTDADGNVVGVEVTTYVPGFWIDVNWPREQGPLGGSGHHFAEVWYGALVDTDGTGEGEWYTQVDTPGNSTSIGGPHDFDFAFTMQANPGGMSAPECFDWIPENVPGGFDEQEWDLTAFEGSTLRVSLWPKGDWDLFVEGPAGTSGAGEGGFLGIEETAIVPFEPGNWTIRGCNFVGEHEVLVTVSVD